MGANFALELLLKESNPHRESPRLLDTAEKGILEVQKVTVKTSLMGKLREQTGVIRGHRERCVRIRLGGTIRLPGKRADEELQAFFLGLNTLEYPTGRVSRALTLSRYRTYKTPSIFTPCL